MSAEDGGVSIMASGPCDRGRKGEGGDGWGRRGDGNTVPTWPHVTAREGTWERGTEMGVGHASDGNRGGGAELARVGYADGISPRW